MAHDFCPWWLGPFLASPLRRLRLDPHALLAPFVHEGMTVFEPGPGMGFFTIELARLVGPRGRVICVDIQSRMLEGLSRRTLKAGVSDRIQARLATGRLMGVNDLRGSVDFVLAYAMVHELPDPAGFFREVAAVMKAGGVCLFAEPAGHVTEADFAASLELARAAGLSVREGPAVRSNRTAFLSPKAI
jgi:ubiquinone/menaquinone biosynthesis C-methylase UbiE